MTRTSRPSTDLATWAVATAATALGEFVTVQRGRSHGRAHSLKGAFSAAEKRIIKAAEKRIIKIVEKRLIESMEKRVLTYEDLPHAIPTTYYPVTISNQLEESRYCEPSNAAIELGIGIAQLIVQVQRMVQESGDPDGFNAAAWVSRWIREPLPALGGERPIDVMGTEEGRAQVSKLIAQAQSGAYA